LKQKLHKAGSNACQRAWESDMGQCDLMNKVSPAAEHAAGLQQAA
jgi:hypothetical protein